MNYVESLRYLYSLADFERSGRFADRKDVEPVKALLEELGNPHLGRITVHIAGSKGKGSVAAMTESILRAAGLKTGLFTSPHLHRFVERIQVDGVPVSKEDWAAGVETVPYDAWVIRRLADGDVVEVKPGAPAEKPKK